MRVQKRRRQDDIYSIESENEINTGSAHLRFLTDRERARDLTKQHSDGVLDGVVQLGAFHGVVKLFPLIIHSAYIRRRVESIICNEENNNLSSRTNVVIELSDCPGGIDILRIVEDFCYGLLDYEKDIRVSQVVKLIATSEFLEVDTLACIALKFLEERVLASWTGCLSVLATFENSELKNVDRLFQTCKTAFLRNIEIESTDLESGMLSVSCNLDCLLRAARLLSPTVAEIIYQSCRSEKFGLCVSKLNQDVDQILCFRNVKADNARSQLDQIPLCTHVRGSKSPTVMDGIIKVEYYPIGEAEEEGIRWLDGLEAEKDMLSRLRRSSLMVHLVKTMYLDNDVKGPARTIYLSRLRWGFLCSLLRRATDHQACISEALHVASQSQAPVGAEERVVAEVLDGKIERTKRMETELRQKVPNLEMLVSRALSETSFWSSKSKQDRDIVQVEGKLGWNSKPDGRLQFVTECIEKFNANTLQAVVEQFRIFNSERSSLLSFGNVLDSCLAANLRKGKYTMWEASSIYSEFPIDLRPSHDGIFHAFENNLKDSSADEVLSVIGLLNYAKLSDQIWKKLLLEIHHCPPVFLEELMESRLEKDRLCNEVTELRNDLRLEKAERMKVAKDKELVERNLAEVTRALTEEKEKMACGICFTRPRNVVCLPCMHFLYCFDCLHVYHQNSNSCPACRGFTSGVLKCHLSL